MSDLSSEKLFLIIMSDLVLISVSRFPDRGIRHFKMATFSQANPRSSHRAQNELFLEQGFLTHQLAISRGNNANIS